MARALPLATAVVAALPGASAAHDVPERIVVQAFVAPVGARLELLLRVPLILLMDADLPRRGPGYLDLGRVDEPLASAAARIVGRLALFENDEPLVPARMLARVSRASDRSFESRLRARDHVLGPGLPEREQVFWNQGYLDALAEYRIGSDGSRFSLELEWPPGLAERITTAVRYLPRDDPGSERAYLLARSDGRVPLDPSAGQAARRFARWGALHVLTGADHLLFLICLLVPTRRVRELVLIASAFTLAHSITLVAAALGLAPPGAAFPPLVETLIAASIVYTAVENIVVERPRRRALIAFVFGLVHGFGFAFALRESLQFAGSHLVVSLAAFNAGIELGQLAALLALGAALEAVSRRTGSGRLAGIVMSALLAHSGWHWMVERGELLRRAPWTAPSAAALAPLAQLLLVVLLAWGALAWGLGRRRRGGVTGSAT